MSIIGKNKLVSVEITTSSYMMESESIGLIDVCTKKCPLSALFRKNCAPIISNTVNVMSMNDRYHNTHTLTHTQTHKHLIKP